MILAAVALAAIVASASADAFSNRFFDKVLLGVSEEIRNEGFDDLGVNGFDVKVNKTGFFNRDFKASFNQGSLIGLSTAVRDGDCDQERSLDDIVITCNVVMPHARLAYDAIVKGDDITGRSHFIATTTYLTNVRVEITVTGKQNENALFSDLVVTSSGPLETNIVQGNLDLNSARKQAFISQMNENLSHEVGEVLARQYTQLLKFVVTRFVL